MIAKMYFLPLFPFWKTSRNLFAVYGHGKTLSKAILKRLDIASLKYENYSGWQNDGRAQQNHIIYLITRLGSSPCGGKYTLI